MSTIAPLVPSAVGPEGTDAMAASSSSSGEQQYSLRWNDFHSSILSTFRNLRDEEDFVDVTLACDSSSFTAHKVVLSACSPYFRRLLKVSVLFYLSNGGPEICPLASVSQTQLIPRVNYGVRMRKYRQNRILVSSNVPIVGPLSFNNALPVYSLCRKSLTVNKIRQHFAILYFQCENA